MNTITRFADYFFVAGVDKALIPGQTGSVIEDPMKTSFQAALIDRLPVLNWEDAPLPPHIWMFCFPNGIELKDHIPDPSFFIFALTEMDGARFYGAALTFYEVIPNEALTSFTAQHPHFGTQLKKSLIYSPTCLCILSHYPFFSVFREYLREVYSSFKAKKSIIPFERLLANLILEVPLPPLGGIRVQMAIGNVQMYCSRSAPHQLPITDFSFRHLFDAIGIYNTVVLIGCILQECKVLFLSEQYSLLTIACETATQLLYPFFWHHVYIPVLPSGLTDFLQAPTPFIIGMHTSCCKQPLNISDLVVVNLDTGQVNLPYTPDLPAPQQNHLINKLKKILVPNLTNLDKAFPDNPGSSLTLRTRSNSAGQTAPPEKKKVRNQDLEIRLAFMEFFVSTLQNYRSHVHFIRRFPKPIAIFHKASFMKENPESVAFLSRFLESTAFSIFLEQHHMFPQNVFDDAIIMYREGKDLYHLPNHRSTILQTFIVTPASEDYKGELFEYGEKFPPLQPHLFYNAETGAVDCAPPLESILEPNYPEYTGDITASTTERDTVAEEFILTCCLSIFDERPIPNAEYALLKDLMKLDTGRLIFAQCLQDLRKKASKPCHCDESFEVMAELMNLALEESHKKADFATPLILMNLTSTFYHKVAGLPEFLHVRVKNQDIWKNNHFWEHAFFESVIEQRKELPVVFNSQPISFEDLSEPEQQDLVGKEENVIFSVLGAFAYNMLNLGVTPSEARHFMSRMASLSFLKEELTLTLLELVKNMEKANSLSDSMKVRRADETPRKRNQNQFDYFATSLPKSESERGQTKELYARLIELKHKNSIHDLAQSHISPIKARIDSSSHLNTGTIPEELYKIEPSTQIEEADRYTSVVMKGHQGGIECIQVDSARIISGSSDGSIYCWSSQTGTFIRALLGHEDRVSALDFDETNIVSGSHDKTVRIWETETGVCSYKLTDHTSSICCLQLQGTLVASGSYDNSIRLWDTRIGKCIGAFNGHTSPVISLQLEESMKTLVSGSRDTSVKVWDIRTFKPTFTLSEHTDWIKKVKFDSHQIISASYDCTLKIWDTKTGKCRRTLTGHRGCVNCFYYENNKLISGSGDSDIRIWDMQTGICSKILQGHSGEVMSLQLTPAGKLISGSFDQNLRLWDIHSGKCEQVLRGHTDWVYCVQTQGHRIISGSWDATIRLWKLKTMPVPTTHRASSSPALIGTPNSTKMKKSISFKKIFERATSSTPSSPSSN